MKWISPYIEEGNWYRGNLHTHTTVSDGGFSPKYALMAYQHMAKHDFVALTDHTKNTHPVEALSFDYMRDLYKDKNFTVIEGREESFAHHILGIGVPMMYDEDIVGKALNEYTVKDYQKLIDLIKEQGGLAYVAHPHWEKTDYWSAETILQLEGLDGIEILNGDRFHRFVVRNLSTDVWDEVLSKGKKLYAISNDDVHSPETFHLYWNVVKAKSNTIEDLLEALKQGSMYCSSGVEFEYIKVDGNKIMVECSHESKFVNCLKYFRFVGKDGETLKLQAGMEHYAEYEAKGDELYVRVELTLNWGLSAFTQPFYLEK